ncbi:MAG: binding domain protein, excisionase family [Acidobacteria bacterium]|nr:binding domain protein, excisionase family [Acidobacteriota bacterium]
MRSPVQPRRGESWSSAEAASAFRVGVSSIKRWTDDGELESVRTPGQHRRYTLVALHRFASIRKLPVDLLPPLEEAEVEALVEPPAEVTLFDALLQGDAIAVRRLVNPRVTSLGQRAAFLDRVVGDALREIGERWEEGSLSVDQEHRASHLIADALDALRPPPRRDGRLALLACPPAEDHELPLRLVRLVLEWQGWRTHLAGARTPWDALQASIDELQPPLVALSARSNEPFNDGEFERVVDHCHGKTILMVGGDWARGGTGGVDGYLRFRTLRGFERWLRSA